MPHVFWGAEWRGLTLVKRMRSSSLDGSGRRPWANGGVVAIPPSPLQLPTTTKSGLGVLQREVAQLHYSVQKTSLRALTNFKCTAIPGCVACLHLHRPPFLGACASLGQGTGPDSPYWPWEVDPAFFKFLPAPFGLGALGLSRSFGFWVPAWALN